MVNYRCPRCGFETNHKAVFKKHLTRKKICEPKIKFVSIKRIVKQYSLKINIDDISKEMFSKKNIKSNNKNKEYCCNYCNKSFTTRQAKSKHQLKVCKINNKNKIIIDKLNETVKEQKNQIRMLLSTSNLSELELKNKDTKLSYNESDHKFISDSKISECMKKQYMSIPHLIKMVHFDPKHPENHNIYVSNIQSKQLFLYDGKKWVLKNKDETIDNLISSSEYKLKETLGKWIKDEENKDKYAFAINKFKKYLEMKDNDQIENNIKEEIKLMLYNNREVCKDFYVHIKK